MKSSTRIILLVLTFLLIAVLTAFAPLEKTLGANARIVYLHGAWVWVALVLFLFAGLAGLGSLVLRRPTWQPRLQSWSQALGRTALVNWVANILFSLYVMQVNWNGIFWDEPRFRVPLNFAVVGLLLQVGLSFFPRSWTAAANVLFAAALTAGMGGIQTVLHPDAPLSGTGAAGIRLVFSGLLVLLLLSGLQVADLWRSPSQPSGA